MGNVFSSIKRPLLQPSSKPPEIRDLETTELRRQLPSRFPSRLSKRFRWEERSPPWLVYSYEGGPTSLSSSLLELATVRPVVECGLGIGLEGVVDGGLGMSSAETLVVGEVESVEEEGML